MRYGSVRYRLVWWCLGLSSKVSRLCIEAMSNAKGHPVFGNRAIFAPEIHSKDAQSMYQYWAKEK